MEIGNEDILAVAIGADVGLQQRRNEQMLANGQYPTFWQRHPLLPYVIGALCFPLVIPAIALVIGYMWMWIYIDAFLGRSGVFILIGWSSVLWIPGLIAAIRNERRYRRPKPGTAVVIHRGR